VAPITLFFDQVSCKETLNAYCLIRIDSHGILSFNPRRDTLLLWYRTWPQKGQDEFFFCKPYAGRDMTIRSLALTFDTALNKHRNLLERMSQYALPEEVVLWRVKSWEDSIAITVTGFVLRAELDPSFMLFKIHRLRVLNVFRIPWGSLPVLKFRRMKAAPSAVWISRNEVV
jgi:hypothetical protein